MSEKHFVTASSVNAQWGYFDATRAPIHEITSGDTVTINTVSGVPAVTPETGYTVMPEHR